MGRAGTPQLWSTAALGCGEESESRDLKVASRRVPSLRSEHKNSQFSSSFSIITLIRLVIWHLTLMAIVMAAIPWPAPGNTAGTAQSKMFNNVLPQRLLARVFQRLPAIIPGGWMSRPGTVGTATTVPTPRTCKEHSISCAAIRWA